MNEKKIAVVGAGITGCTIANLFAQLGYKVDVFEKTDTIGGACSDTFKCLAYRQNHGSHIFHTEDFTVWGYLSSFVNQLGHNWYPYQHKVKALVEGKEVPIPVNVTTLKELSSDNDAKMLLQELKDNGFSWGKSYSFEDLEQYDCAASKYLTDFIWELFFSEYSYKQWGEIPDKEVLSRVKAFRFSKDDRYFLDTYQGIPSCGFTTMMRRMLDCKEIDVNFNSSFELDKVAKYYAVFYTGSIDELFNYEYGELPYRSCRFDISVSSRPHTFDRAVTNYPSLAYSYTRAHDYSYFIPTHPYSTIAFEHPCNYKRGENERYYPLSKKEDAINLYLKYFNYSKENYPTIHYAGRLGTYRYLDMDKAVKDAMSIVEDFIKNEPQNDIC